MGKILLFIILYIIIPPAIMGLLKAIKTYLKSYLFGRRQSKTAINQGNLKEGLNEKISNRVKFTLKDKRNEPIPFRLVFLFIYSIGLVVAIASAIFSNPWFFLVAICIAYISVIFSYITANEIVKKRDEVLGRMVQLKASKMRLANSGKGVIARPSDEFQIVKWDEDLVSPAKMYIYMPTDFDILGIDQFLESWNLVFGSNGQWIADKSDEQYGGFDFNAGVAAIRVSPKLPTIANWHTRYLDPEHVHWSFFPLAIGSENGIPIYNEEIDAIEHVLGFSVNSGQNKLSKKNGVVIGDEIVAAPQSLIAGGTGGGKSLNSRSKIVVISE